MNRLTKDTFFAQTNCSRCGKELTTRIMSKMNEEVICLDCAEAERKHSLHKEAVEAELAEVKAGNYNYPGLFAGQKYPFDLRKALMSAYVDNMQNGVKAVEVALQKVIENRFPGKPWWKTCNVPIFNRLFFDKVTPSALAEEIEASIEHF